MARQKNWSYNSYDETEDISVVGNYIWDTGSLAWIKQTASAGGAGLTDAELRATPVPVSGPLTDAELRAVAVPVSGTVAATQSGAWNIGTVTTITNPVAVTGTFWQATQPVSGPLTDAQLRAVAVPVSGTFFQATQPVSIAATVQVDVTDEPARDLGKVDIASLDQYTPVSGRLPVDGSGVTQPVSGTFWQATQPVSGPLTDAQLRASAVPVSGTVTGNIASIDGEPSLANAQVSVTTTSAVVVAARAGRRSLLIVNHGTTDVYLGTGTVTTANGVLLKGTAGASISIPTVAAVNGIVGSGTQTVSYIEVF